MILGAVAAQKDISLVELADMLRTEFYLPPYSPDFNPIENAFSKLFYRRRLRTRLGRVDKPDPLLDRSQLCESEKATCGMIVSGGHAPAVFEPVEESLDPVAGGVEREVNRMLNAPVLFGRNFRLTTTRADVITDGITIVAAVG